MSSRAEIIAKTKSDLGDLNFNVSTTDTAANGNLYFYALNDSLSQMGIGTTDGDLASVSLNDVRVASIGCQYYFIKSIIKKKLSEVRVDHDNVSRDTFSKIMEFMRIVKKDWEDALSTADLGIEVNRYAESVVTWGSSGDNASFRSTEGNNAKKDNSDLYISEFGEDLTNYQDDGE